MRKKEKKQENQRKENVKEKTRWKGQEEISREGKKIRVETKMIMNRRD